MKKIIAIILVLVLSIPFFTAYTYAENDEDLAESNVLDLSDNEILDLYSKAIKKAKREKPLYRLENKTNYTSPWVDISDPLRVIKLLGYDKEEVINDLEADLELSNEYFNVIVPMGSMSSHNSLPPECSIMDASLLENISIKKNSEQEVLITIVFNDETNPQKNSPICSLLGYPDYDTILNQLKGEFGDFIDYSIALKWKINEYSLKNAKIICEFNPRTYEIYKMNTCCDIFWDYSLISLFKADAGYSCTEDLHYVFFDYPEYLTNMLYSVSIGDDFELGYKESSNLNPIIDVDDGVDYSVKFESSDPNVAYVDENGNVIGTKRWRKDAATIICTVSDEYGNQVSDTITVTVGYTWWQWIIGIVLLDWI